MKKFVQNTVLLLTSLAIAFFIGEMALRMLGYYGVRTGTVGPIHVVDDQILDYRLPPNAEWVNYGILSRTNNKGWRDYNYSYTKPEGVFRIVMLGDSVLNGHGIHMEQVFAKHLERRLNMERISGKFEVIMLAMGALNTAQEAHLLEVEGLKYDPDLVIVAYVLNDIGPGASLQEKMEKKRTMPWADRVKEYLKQSSLIYYSYNTTKDLSWQLAIPVLGGWAKPHESIQSDVYTAGHNDRQRWKNVVVSFEKIQTLS